jgi:AcrR family transcriptional regulator
MATRKYSSSRRLSQVRDRQQRVAAATAQLHAEKGPVATSYAAIAQRAGVSLPTVHSYFPSQDAMMSACTGHVAAGAPALPVEEILAATDLRTAASTLIVSMDRLHAYFEPWVSWRADTGIPFLAQLRDSNRDRLVALLLRVLSLHRKGSQVACAAAWESLLSFDLWQRLVREHGLPRTRVRALLNDLLLSALGPEWATSPPSGPRRRP